MRPLLRSLPPVAAWLAGLLVAFYPVLFTGFARTPGDLGDARLVNFLLEHDWRWLTGRAGHRDLWSPPVFYPAAHTAAYSDLLLSALPFYAPWRLLGLPPDTPFQLLLLTAVPLHFWSPPAPLARCLPLPACRPSSLGGGGGWGRARLGGALRGAAPGGCVASPSRGAPGQGGAFPADALAGTPPVPLWWLNRGPDAWLSSTRLLVRLGWL